MSEQERRKRRQQTKAGGINYIYVTITAMEIIASIAPQTRIASMAYKALKYRNTMRKLNDLTNVIRKGWPT